ncbi:hypothetical protein H2198_003498 [Neophaeococcomyces mojaviensis]|uniref:Uncharacterized protein n=1 Tax=Neophaeococcomyces mojaviensis TaxID=3383035 RepID=A0ACC3ABK5_9EURO|nr:hypothetical protein H2198_003498 [Knufia sp. JES_112]
MEGLVPSPPAKRQKLAYHHKHRIQHKAPVVPGEPALLPQELLDKLLVDSIKSICEEQAYKHDVTEPGIESVALEALRSATDEFVHNLCQKVRRSMLAARRSVPIAPDFDSAFYALDLPLPDDQLPAYETKPPINRPLLPTPPPDDEFHNTHELPQSFLGSELSRQKDLKSFSFNTSSLPPLPSAHTYKDTAVFVQRETDPKRIRELATEEGKLGEQALRKLAGAVKLEAALSTEPETRTIRDRRPPRLRRDPVLTEEAMFEETMRDLLKQEPGDFELGPIVSSEKQYRMPDEGRVKRRPVATSPAFAPGSGSNAADALASGKYNLLPPPMSKPKPSGARRATDDMDLVLEL